MLTPEFGETLEHAGKHGELLVEFADKYGRMQSDSASHIGALAERVKPDFDLRQYPSAVEAYVNGPRVSAMLEAEEVLELKDALTKLNEAISELRGGPVPQTIVHGDLGPYNLAELNGKPVAFDWSTAGVSFPFFDMVELLHRVRPLGAGGNASAMTSEVDGIKQGMKRAYLGAWSSCASSAEIERLWRVAEPLGFMSMALHLPFPYFPRRVLQYIREAA